jgi:hypothetical protein
LADRTDNGEAKSQPFHGLPEDQEFLKGCFTNLEQEKTPISTEFQMTTSFRTGP